MKQKNVDKLKHANFPALKHFIITETSIVSFLDVRPYRQTHANIYVYVDSGHALNWLYILYISEVAKKPFPRVGNFCLGERKLSHPTRKSHI